MSLWIVYSVAIVFLILFSAFFSGSETGLMAANRYRIRHKARQKKRSAILILRLLKRPDRLLGTILIGNSVANILASALATLLAEHYWGNRGVVVSTIILTLFILVVAEVAPKTVAALYPERIATIAAWPVSLLLKLFYPLVWFVNALSNGLLRLFGVKMKDSAQDSLSREELRSVVHEANKRISRDYQDMLLGILDLNKVTVNDVMVPRHKIVGIDLTEDWQVVCQKIHRSTHEVLPVYRDNINQIMGVLYLRELMRELLAGHSLTQDILMRKIQEAYFVPENTPLNIQLLNFQREQKQSALVVDEYGDVLGFLSLSDILEQIVGAFTTDIAGTTRLIQKQADGSYLVDGSLAVREFNRLSGWELPMRGPRTLSGLIIEYLEAIPRPGTCVRIKNYPIEVVHIQDNRVKVARLFPSLSVS